MTGCNAGFDLGLTHFLTLDSGEVVENPRYLRNAQARLRRAHRALARKKRGGRNRRKQRAWVAAHHREIRNARRDFHHKVARTLVTRYDAIYHEDLNVRGMVRNHRLAQSISDASWSQFIAILSGKAAEAGRSVIAVNPAGTSQTCLCGARGEKTLKDRWHACPSCGLSLSRDRVSAMLIKRLGHSRCAGTEQDAAPVPQEAVCLS
jgi:putative transposase